MSKRKPREISVLAQLIAEAKRRGFTMRQAGELSGLPSSTMHKWWNGEEPMQLERLERLADSLGYVLSLEPKP